MNLGPEMVAAFLDHVYICFFFFALYDFNLHLWMHCQLTMVSGSVWAHAAISTA